MLNFEPGFWGEHWGLILFLISESILIAFLLFNIRSRRSMEHELRESAGTLAERNKFIESLMNMSPDVIYIYDLVDQKNIYSNQGIQKVLGYSVDEIKGMGDHLIQTLMNPDDFNLYVSAILEKYSKAKDGEMISHEYRMKHKNGDWLWLESNEHIYKRQEDGSPKQIFGVIHDITERKRSDEVLHRSETKYRLLFENMTAGFALHEMIYDGQGRPVDYRFLEINPAFEKLTGASASALIGRTIKEVMPSTEQYWIDIYGKVAQTGEPTAYQNYSKELGRYYDVWAFSPLKHRFAVVFTDITERKMVEEALKESERQFRQTLENANLIAVQLNNEGLITFANNFFAELTGWDIKEIIGKNWMDIFIPDAIREHIRDIHAENIILKGIVKKYENDILTKAGEKRLIAWTNSHMFGAKGEIIGVTSLGIDITEHRRLEEQLSNIQKLEAVGTLAGGIAHDFNNLLQGIFGYLSMARININNHANALSMIEQAEKALHLSVKLTSQLLTFAKGGKPEKRLIKLSSVIENSVKFALSGSNCSCSLDITETLWSADADEGQISQVLQNIVLNAVQAMPIGGTIEVAARNLEADNNAIPAILEQGRYVAISIRDVGIGIPAEYLSRIFDPYFTTKEKGSGLGLATSYSIIKNHGGLIDVSSQAGKGTLFTIYIPAITDFAEDETKAAVLTATRTCKVLVMDDEDVVRTVVRELISSLGHEVEVAEHGEAALKKYKRAKDSDRPFDIVILDLTIRGGMGGAETLNKLKELDPEVKVIVSSGYSEDASLAEYKKQGFVAVLKKPYDIDRLQITLNEIIAV
ncbi:MAG: PAS domain S-box protein [Nitrospirae bacterium]|nr:PAS domain S-box protein [Nitrospirota bacterium]